MPPLICAQCNCNTCVDGWRICPTCYESNLAYARTHDKYRREVHHRPPYHRRKDTGYTSKENCWRKCRTKEEHADDEGLHPSEQNARTEYHGDNYADE